jgi:hypothetical protein
MLGHASAAMTLGVYSGLFEDDLGALAERIDAAHEAHESSRTVGTVWARDLLAEIDNSDGTRRPALTLVGRVGLEPTTQGL